MKTITMKSTQRGAPHGHTVSTFEQGRTYETSDALADIFIADGHAIEGAKLAENHGTEDNRPKLFDAEGVMKNDELAAVAAKLGIDITGLKSKEERRNAIRAKLAENAAAEAEKTGDQTEA
jgi:hypothetical protein